MSAFEVGPGALPTPHGENPGPAMRLVLTRPRPHTVLLQLFGEFDHHQVPRMVELLDARLRSLLHAVVVDCGGLSFLSLEALEALTGRALLARQNGIAFTVVTGQSPATNHEYAAAKLNQLARVVTTVDEALSTASVEIANTIG